MHIKTMKIITLFFCLSVLTGCSTFEKAKKADELNFELSMLKKKMEKLKSDKDNEIAGLRKENDAAIQKAKADCQNELAKLQDKKQKEMKDVVTSKTKELSDLEKAKLALEKKLSAEIGDYKARLEMTERGLVITFLSEIFFDSGKDIIKPEGQTTLQKMIEVLKKDVSDSNIAVEGHTDNDPIRHSGWKSNWELSSARALSVVHFLIESGNISPKRLSAIGYGEYRPVKSNDTVEDRRQNRRVEIVILPSNLKKIK